MKRFILIGIVLLIHLLLLIKTQFTLWPEIVSSPYLLIHGYTLYKDFIHPYPPLLTFMLYVLFKLFGFKILILKIVVWLTILISDLLLYKIARFFKVSYLLTVGVLLLYVFLQTYLDGNMLWYDTALTLPTLLFVYYFIQKKFLKAFTTLLLMCFIKQSAVFIFLVFILFLLFHKKWEVITKGVCIVAVPVLFFLLYLYSSSSLYEAYLWVFYYPATYWSQFPGYVQLHLTRHELLSIFVLSAPSILLLLKSKNKIFSVFYFSALISVYPRFSFFHFQPALACSIISFIVLLSQTRKRISTVLFVLAMLLGVFILKPYLQTATTETRFLSQSDIELSAKLQSIIPAGSYVYLLNVPSQQYVLTKTFPPSPWLDNYGWYFEMPHIESNTLSLWKQNPPQYIVWKEKEGGNWYDIGVYEPKGIVSWIQNNYIQELNIGDKTWIWKRKH